MPRRSRGGRWASGLGAILLLVALWPTPALAQEPRAGVVTTLHGQATLTRAVLPRPVPLKFKDDVLGKELSRSQVNFSVLAP